MVMGHISQYLEAERCKAEITFSCGVHIFGFSKGQGEWKSLGITALNTSK
jgi:hypothetical protein